MAECGDPPPDNARPPDMTSRTSRTIEADICVVGAGSAGLSVAAGAARLGARTVLIESGRMGGECLNVGCVPSKALIAAATRAQAVRSGSRFGVGAAEPSIDFAAVRDHVRSVIAGIAPHDSVERFEGLGVTVIGDRARFVSPQALMAGSTTVKARRFVVATGSRPAMPPIPGLTEAGPLTNETIFDLETYPRHLAIIGGGAIGLELAQAFRRLGAAVTVLERQSILPRDEPEAASAARRALTREGVEVHEQTAIESVSRETQGAVRITFRRGDERRRIEASHLLVAAGRTAAVADLGLDAAGIRHGPDGIEVDARLRTANRRVFALGDVVAGAPRFTHAAAYQAGIVVRNALFALPARVDYRAMPRVTYLDPEVAGVGLTEAEARDRGLFAETVATGLDTNDRARTEGAPEGFAKLVLGRRGRILGVTIVAPHAGELIGLWGLAIARGVPLSALAGTVLPYPTYSELSKKVAGDWIAPRLFSPRVRGIVGLIQRWLP